MPPAIDILVAILLLLGAGFTLLGSIGLVRFSDVLLRLHGPTKAGTLGVGCVLIASALYFSSRGEGVSVHELLITLFIFLTAPVSAQLMAKCALFLARTRDRPEPPGPAVAADTDRGQGSQDSNA
ncbi:MAG TPA: Na+/H+ antiporter subunit G [Rhodocyclaceae bacterium]